MTSRHVIATLPGGVQALSSMSPVPRVFLLSRALWEEAGRAVQGAWRPQAGFTLNAAQCRSVLGAAPAGGAQRPPAGAVWPLQVSSRRRRWRIMTIISLFIFKVIY